MDHTYIIESNRRTAYRQEFDAEKNRTIGTTGVDMPSNKWRTTIPTGIKLNEGDEISIEASNINIRGDAGATMEFTGGETNSGDNPISDNNVDTKFGFYINNNMEFNFPLPTARHRCAIGADVTDGGEGKYPQGHTHLDTYGMPLLSTYTQFANAFPFQGLAGFGTGLTQSTDGSLYVYGLNPSEMDGVQANYPPLVNAPIEIFNPNSHRFYKLTENESGLYWSPGAARATPIYIDQRYWTESTDILDYETINLSVDKGFITPSSVGDFLTAQLQMEDGAADQATTVYEYMAISGLALNSTEAIQNAVLAKVKTNNFSTKSYKIFPTTCGDFAKAYYDGTWSGTYMNINGKNTFQKRYPVPTTSGVGYREQEGQEMWWKNIMTSDIPQYLCAKMMSKFGISTHIGQQATALWHQSKADGSLDARVILDGGRACFSANAGAVQPPLPHPPSLGQQLCSVDSLNYMNTACEAMAHGFPANSFGKLENSLFCSWNSYVAGDGGAIYGLVLPNPELAENENYLPPCATNGIGVLLNLPHGCCVTTNCLVTKESVKAFTIMANTNAFPDDTELYQALNDVKLKERGASLQEAAQALVFRFRFGRADDTNTSTTTRQWGSKSQEDLYDTPSTNQVNLVNPFIANFYYDYTLNPANPGRLRGYGYYTTLLKKDGTPWTSDAGTGNPVTDTNYFTESIGTMPRYPGVASPYKKDKPNVKYYTAWNDRFDPQHPQTVVTLPVSYGGEVGGDYVGSNFSFTDPDGNYFDTSIFKPTGTGIHEQGLAAVGVFLRYYSPDKTATFPPPVWSDTAPAAFPPDVEFRHRYFTPYIALISAETINPNENIITHPHLALPVPCELFGVSRSVQDLQLSKIISTQKLIDPEWTAVNFRNALNWTGFRNTIDGGLKPSKFSGIPAYTESPFIHTSTCHIGANQPQISFDNGLGRFKIDQLTTAKTQGNGSYSDGFIPVSVATPTQGKYDANKEPATEVVSMYQRGCSISQYYSGFISAAVVPTSSYYLIRAGTGGWRPAQGLHGMPNYFVSQIVDDICPVNSAQSGIALLGMDVPDANNSNNLNELTSWKPYNFSGCLFDKMGFSIEQLLPLFGQGNSVFNRNTHARFLGFDKSIRSKYHNCVKPLTTNAFISGGLALSFTLDNWRSPMENLGSPTFMSPVNADAESDGIIAQLIPKKLAYPYLIVHSDIIQSRSTYYGSSYTTTVPAIGFVQRNYDSSDFFYGFATSWRYVIDKSFVLNEFIVDIVLPTGRPAPLDDNSSIIFKITKNANTNGDNTGSKQDAREKIKKK